MLKKNKQLIDAINQFDICLFQNLAIHFLSFISDIIG